MLGANAVIHMIEREVLDLGVWCAGFIASVYDGTGGRLVFALIASAMLEFLQSQAAPSLDWSYQFSWAEFLLQTLIVALIAQLIGRLIMPRLSGRAAQARRQ